MSSHNIYRWLATRASFKLLTPQLMQSCNDSSLPCSGMEGQVRLADGQSGPGYEYGRLEVFRRGFWGNVGVAGATTPVNDALTLASTQVACSDIGFDGGAVLRFAVPYQTNEATVVPVPTYPSIRCMHPIGVHVDPACVTTHRWSC